MSYTLVPWTVFALGFWLLASVPARGGAGRSSVVLRFFVPNYRFFEGTGHPIEFEFRRDGADEAWLSVVPEALRSFRSMFLNAEGTFRLFAYQLADEFLFELEELGPTSLDVAEALVSFERLKVVCLHYHGAKMGMRPFQLRLRAIDVSPATSSEVLFESTPQVASSGPSVS